MLKAESILKDGIPICKELSNIISELKPGQCITWPVYDGDDVLAAKKVESYVTAFFKTGEVMPIPILTLGLNIHTVQTEYDDERHIYKVIIEGFLIKPKNK